MSDNYGRYDGFVTGLGAGVDYLRQSSADQARLDAMKIDSIGRSNELGQRKSEFEVVSKRDQMLADAEVRAKEAAADLARGQLAEEAKRTQNTYDVGMAGVGAQRYGVDRQYDLGKLTHETLGAADKATLEQNRVGNQDAQNQRLGQAWTGFGRTLADADKVTQGNPVAAADQLERFVLGAATSEEGKGLAATYFGTPDIKGIRPVRAGTNVYLVANMADGTRKVRGQNGELIDYSTDTLTAAEPVTLGGLSQHAAMQGSMRMASATPQAIGAGNEALGKGRQQQAEGDMTGDKSLISGAATSDALTARTTEKVAKADDALAKATDGAVQGITDTFDTQRAGVPLLGITPTTGMTKDRVKQFPDSYGKNPDAVVKNILKTQTQAIIKDAPTLAALRSLGVPVPETPYTAWSADEMTAVTNAMSQGLMALLSSTEGNPFEDGLDEKELAIMQTGVAPRGAIPSPKQPFKNEGLGKALNYFSD